MAVPRAPKLGIFMHSTKPKFARSVCLSWCRIEMFSSNNHGTGGWLAEHFIGYSRLFLICYAHLSVVCDNKSIDIHLFHGLSYQLTVVCVSYDD